MLHMDQASIQDINLHYRTHIDISLLAACKVTGLAFLVGPKVMDGCLLLWLLDLHLMLPLKNITVYSDQALSLVIYTHFSACHSYDHLPYASAKERTHAHAHAHAQNHNLELS